MTIALLGDRPRREEIACASNSTAWTCVSSQLPSPKDFFEGKAPHVDAFAMSGRGRRGLVDPVPGLLGGGAAAGRDRELPVGVGMRKGDTDLAGVVNDWLVIQRSAGVLSQVRDYWVLGQGARREAAALVDPP